uniref:Uncharacterized protein n=1 Tax=Nelumbo nucifera TaxID=4432 RepID=A0A822Z8I2_NELNU|nr:TPA_asm: hypothetical protein HUJ06_014314 [Nelumbo nucifera]
MVLLSNYELLLKCLNSASSSISPPFEVWPIFVDIMAEKCDFSLVVFIHVSCNSNKVVHFIIGSSSS